MILNIIKNAIVILFFTMVINAVTLIWIVEPEVFKLFFTQLIIFMVLMFINEGLDDDDDTQ